ncbi:TonB-dependent receptor [Frateuria sp. STR12]|uniref:TonB-dependent receptor n=1 Tax=Frateuria hangzhouensis TaxID=2995589 RepID=UPI002260CF01|nr:TonB-dependent receptor [Frateuria sp. STR12]MCX7513227.1 TonB-dependent receptor [Frateuria sp. STR12]
MSRRYLVWSLSYAALGMALGIYMAASHNHGQLVTHAHVLMVGFVLSLVYGIIHRLWLDAPRRAVAMTQFVLHQLAAVALLAGLFMLYGGKAGEETLEPLLGIGSVGVLAGMLLMLYMVLRPGRARSAEPGAPDQAAA